MFKNNEAPEQDKAFVFDDLRLNNQLTISPPLTRKIIEIRESLTLTSFVFIQPKQAKYLH